MRNKAKSAPTGSVISSCPPPSFRSTECGGTTIVINIPRYELRVSDIMELGGCCGIKELANIYEDKNPNDSIMEVTASDQGVVVFSDVKETKPPL